MLQSCSEKLAVNRKSHFAHPVISATIPRARATMNRTQHRRADQPVKLLQIAGIDFSFAR
ncbi:MAG TPA: hypothetical protein VGH19_20035 [Verrucomicrobiae bacterium]